MDIRNIAIAIAIKTIISRMYFGEATKVEYKEFVFANNFEYF